MRNWLNMNRIGVLPFMDAAVSIIGFGATVANDGYTARLQADIKACIDAELSDLRQVAQERGRQLQDTKNEYGHAFAETVAELRPTVPNRPNVPAR